MTLDTLLQELGLTADQAAGVLADEWFLIRNEATLRERLGIMQETYGCTRQQIGEVIVKHPQFASYDHARVIREAVKIYGTENTERLKEAILKHPPFASLDHTRVIREATEVYGAENTERVEEAILKHPPFAGLDHTRVISEAAEVYETVNTGRVKEAILKFPQFADLDHTRVIREAVEVYGTVNIERVKEAILKFPPFAGYDHARVLRQAARLGRLVGLLHDQCLEHTLHNPRLVGYSAKRHLAVIDIGRSLVKEGYDPEEMLEVYLGCCSFSPYLPGRKRISQAAGPEPPLMKVMRRRLRKL